MNFKPNNGVLDGTIPVDKRGVILPSTKAATDLRQSLAAMSPRLAGKKIAKEGETK